MNYADSPVLNSPTFISATTIALSWTQLGSDVDSYTVSYTYTIRQCGPGVMSGSQSISDGSARSYELSGLEEDSDYTITLAANTAAGTASSQISVNTNTTGIYNYVHIPVAQSMIMHNNFQFLVEDLQM